MINLILIALLVSYSLQKPQRTNLFFLVIILISNFKSVTIYLITNLIQQFPFVSKIWIHVLCNRLFLLIFLIKRLKIIYFSIWKVYKREITCINGCHLIHQAVESYNPTFYLHWGENFNHYFTLERDLNYFVTACNVP